MIYGFTFYVLVVAYLAPNAHGYVVEPNPQTFMTYEACDAKQRALMEAEHPSPYSIECHSVSLPVAVP